MANKTKTTRSTQSTLFDLPAVPREIKIPIKKIETEQLDLTSLGLVSITEGRSKVFANFTHAIKELRMTEKQIEVYNRVKRELEGMTSEDDHSRADRLLCQLLDALGFEDITKLFDNLPKWYE